jgi:signal transduction histidine kinase
MDFTVLGGLSRRGIALAAVVLTLGVGAGAAASASLASAERDATSAELALRTASVRDALDTTFARYADTLHHLVALTRTQPPATLAASVAGIADERLPGAHQVLIVAADRAVLAQQTVDGSTPLRLTAVAAEPELDRALDLSRTSGRLVASNAHVLPADLDLPPAHRQLAFELAAPVLAGSFLGWVVVSVRGPDLLESSLRTAGITGVAAVLTETASDGIAREVAGWSQGGTTGGAAATTVEIALAGHAWQVVVRPTTSLVGAGRDLAAPLTLLGAALLSVLLALLVLRLDGVRKRATRRADRAAAELRAGLDRAERAEQTLSEREAELAGLAAAASEHLQLPLHTIAGFTDLLLEEARDPDSRDFLDRIATSAQRMLDVVDELVAYTAATDAALLLEPVDAERLTLDVAAAHVDVTAGDRPSIDVGGLPVVTADAVLLREVLDQLVGNAVRYVRHGTAARITVSARQLDRDWWRFEVADRGIGVPAEHRRRVFAPFQRTPAAEGYPGTGLGLAVCQRIIDRHGGEIGVEVNPGGGSVFWFTVAAGAVTLSPDDLEELASA